ncbi:MAG: Cj0069 family protein [Mycobacteriaceae bacterium]
MFKSIVIFETEGGTDKWFDGHRRDTSPIVDALRVRGWDCEVLYYRDEWAEDLFNYCADRYDGYISRVNPGGIVGGEKKYLDFLRRLSSRGLLGMSHPDEMLRFGAKDALVKLVDTDVVPDDTAAYYSVEAFHEKFPVSLSYGERVLKQNRGSTGVGIWRVRPETENLVLTPGVPLTPDTLLHCTEAVDNHSEVRSLGEFMNFCNTYIEGENGMLVDMRFLPRIVEGEIRILLVGEKPVFIVHKKPAESDDAFSATLFSGAKYTYSTPEQWPELIDLFTTAYPRMLSRLGVDEAPLIWTADFILDTRADGSDAYILSEFNCSCVGFTSHLDWGIQGAVADEVVRRVEQDQGITIGEEHRTYSLA